MSGQRFEKTAPASFVLLEVAPEDGAAGTGRSPELRDVEEKLRECVGLHAAVHKVDWKQAYAEFTASGPGRSAHEALYGAREQTRSREEERRT